MGSNWVITFTPIDEYDPEINRIYDIVTSELELDVEYLGNAIYDIFKDMFGSNIFLKNLDECKKIAEDIIELSQEK